MLQRTFDTPLAPEISIALPAGRIDVEAVDATETSVEVEPLDSAAARHLDDVRVEFAGSSVVIEAPERQLWLFSGDGFAVRVRCPVRSRLAVRSGSADVTARGTLGGIEIKTASGDVRGGWIDGPARVQTASGNVRLDHVARRADVTTASGDVRIGEAGDALSATLVSGDLTIGTVAGTVDAKTVSGKQWFGTANASVTTKSVSGDVSIGVRRGATVWLDIRSVSGDTTTDLAMTGDEPESTGDVLEVRARSVSGDVRITRAEAAAAAS